MKALRVLLKKMVCSQN